MILYNLGSNTNEAAFFMQINFRDKFGDYTNYNPITTMAEFREILNKTVPQRYRERYADYLDRLVRYYDPTRQNASK